MLRGGPRAVFTKIGHRLRLACIYGLLPRALRGNAIFSLDAQFQRWLEQNQLRPADVERMRRQLETFTYKPLISIVIPVYNTEKVWLCRAIESLQTQLYPRWEMCLVNDASTETHIASILNGYAVSDPRIRVKHLDQRLGITGASREALGMARGEFVGFLDHDDELTPDALLEVTSWLNRNPELDLLYCDEDKLTPSGARIDPFFKPDWSPDLLLSMNYIAHFALFRRSVLQEIGGFRSGYEGAQDHDLLLRFTDQTDRIAHIPKIFYHWRMSNGSSANPAAVKPFASDSGRRAVEDALLRREGDRVAVEILSPGRYRARYIFPKSPLVSIVIPTKDQIRLLRQCILSIEEKTTYPDYEIIIIDNNSTDPETLRYLDTIAAKHKVMHYSEQFNFSAISNFGAEHASGEYILFLNNDTEVINSEWLAAMAEQAHRPEIGAVGAKLLYPDGRIQHAGVVLGVFGEAGHAFRNLPDNHTSYFGLADVVRNCSAVTAACMMVARKAFKEVGGFDEELKVVYNDVDLCLRMRKKGYLIVYCPFAVLRHYESATRGRLRPPNEEDLFYRRWRESIRLGDPYYNPNLTLMREDWSLRI
jgi:GT2 family glycosyltransferase